MIKSNLTEEQKKQIILDVNLKIGGDINNLENAYDLENEFMHRRNYLQRCLNVVSDEVPTKLTSAIKKAELNSEQIEKLKDRSEKLKEKVNNFLNKIQPLTSELDIRFTAIHKLEDVMTYMKSFAKIQELSNQMKQCKDEEQVVQMYSELKSMCNQYPKAHQAAYVKEYTHYWHNVLKDNLTKHYEDVLRLLKWPFTSAAENSPPPKEVLTKFTNLTRYLFLIQEPEDLVTDSGDSILERNPCLPVKILLRPLKKRFTFHFTGSRQTARIDRPEWFLTQTLMWIRDHQTFVKDKVQPVADKLKLRHIRAVEEFCAGLIGLAAERLHTVLALYHTQGSKGEIVDVDAAFAHAVDETLGFHKELVAITGCEDIHVLTVLTRAETFVRWLAVEKKYALSKMDETLGNEQWSEPVAGGVSSAVGSLVWVPRGADWFITLLKTIEDRYVMLPQPGHRLQFLELQLELIEEWRIRLTQLLSAAADALCHESFLVQAPPVLIAVINTAHHTRIVLLQWAHSLHYLQLHYYRRQFQHFTQQQHHDEESVSSTSSEDDEEDEESEEEVAKKSNIDEDGAISLIDVESNAKTLAMREVIRRSSSIIDTDLYELSTPIANLAVTDPLPAENDEQEEAGVFAEAPALLAHLRDAGIAGIAEHILFEFKATIRDYKKQKWHAMMTVEAMALCVSCALCGPLSSLCARLSAAAAALAPRLAARLRALLALHIDHFLFEDVVLESWFNTGGTLQFTHDVKRNLVPAFAPPNKNASQSNPLPKLVEACKLLNMDYDDARRLRSGLIKQQGMAAENLITLGITHVQAAEALQILNQRTDLSDSSPSVMELF